MLKHVPTSSSHAFATSPKQSIRLSELLYYVEHVLHHGIPGFVWVQAELAAVTDKRHLYMDLLEVGETGEQAKCKAILWATERYHLETKLKQAVGSGFVAGMRVLLFCSVEFHAQYGFSLNVKDVAPEVSVGAAVLRLEAMREQLISEGVYGQNKALMEQAPLQDIEKLVVISPHEAAGLQDFRRELDTLADAGVLQVEYISAVFQGHEAAHELQNALEKAKTHHAQHVHHARHAQHEGTPLDALVILRGGGAVSDLAWLNHVDVAREVALFPVPVITGLGHAKDNTLLDEVAAIRTDTPSKAAAWITRLIAEQVVQAEQDYRFIVEQSARSLEQAQSDLDRRKAALVQQTEQQLRLADQSSRYLMAGALGFSPARTLARGYARAQVGGKTVRSLAQAQQLQRFDLEFYDGTANVAIIQNND